jgi:dTDP-4-amino-4,6-dideoxygalactose transaminase
MASPFNDRWIEDRVISILRSGKLVQGKVVEEFEKELAAYLGCKHVVAVNSGTAALHLAIACLVDSKEGCRERAKSRHQKCEIVTTPLSFAATANAIFQGGCTPVFADIDIDTFNIDPSLVEEKASEGKTLAVEPVDVYGLPADLQRIGRIAGRMGISVVEDAAEAIGARYHDSMVGNCEESTFACFSTYATKNLHTGEGGFVTTNDDSLAAKARLIRNQGQVSKYNHELLGYNYRMLEISAAIGLGQVGLIDDLVSRRRENALFLKEQLGRLPCLDFQDVDAPENHAWYLFAAVLDERKAGIKRDKLVSRLRESGVEADVAWPTPIHLQPYYRRSFGYREGDFPNAEKICKQVFQLPIHPFLTRQELERVVTTTETLLRK